MKPAAVTGTGRGSRAFALLANTALVVIWLGALFGAAGTLRWPTGWVTVALVGGGLLAHQIYVARKNPGLLARRRQMRPGTKSWDKVWVAVFWLLMIGGPAVAGLDAVRFRWSSMTPWLWPLGAAAFAAGMVLSAWAMAVNPHFEGTVRIQEDQAVVDVGPYRLVRHPGYLGLALWAISTPFLLFSWWALVPATVTAAWVLVRTALEDRLLQDELPGYGAYAARVCWRLVPKLW